MNTPSTNDVQSITGTLANPFDSIYDAIIKAYELGAPYIKATVTIKLLEGTHSMLRTNWANYIPSASDKHH